MRRRLLARLALTCSLTGALPLSAAQPTEELFPAPFVVEHRLIEGDETG